MNEWEIGAEQAVREDFDRDQIAAARQEFESAASSGRSKQRPIRIPDDPWYRAVARAKSEGRPIGHVVTEMLAAYADQK